MNNISEEDKLSWGDVDFIEESASFSTTPLEFQEIENIEISEAESEKSPFKVIGKVKGCIAPIGCMSRNGRLYESTHWQKILAKPELQERIANRRFMGMISHENKPIDDQNFKAGEISHVCSLLEVRNDDNGKPFLYGELDILDTPAGRILKAMYEGGAGLYVSTRAAGKLLESVRDGKPIKVVDPNSYYVSSIDFVLNPGFLQAKPAFEAVETPKVQPSLHESQVKSSEVPNISESQPTSQSDIQKLESQIGKLTKIIEKVVDDIYEEPTNEEVQKQPIVEPELEKAPKEKKEEKGLEKPVKEALADFVSLMANTNISEKSFEEIIDIIANAKKEDKE